MPKKNYETKLHPTYEVRNCTNNSMFMPIGTLHNGPLVR
jgi:hypothetical protein